MLVTRGPLCLRSCLSRPFLPQQFRGLWIHEKKSIHMPIAFLGTRPSAPHRDQAAQRSWLSRAAGIEIRGLPLNYVVWVFKCRKGQGRAGKGGEGPNGRVGRRRERSAGEELAYMTCVGRQTETAGLTSDFVEYHQRGSATEVTELCHG